MSMQPPFDPTSPRFLVDPYAAYAALRARPRGGPAAGSAAPGLVHLGPPYDAWWVVGHALVEAVCDARQAEFLKPGQGRAAPPRPFGIGSRLADGLFFLDPPRHGEVRKMMESLLAPAVQAAPALAGQLAPQLLAGAMARGRFDLIGDFAAPLAMQVFMSLFGIPAPNLQARPEDDPHRQERMVLDLWLRAMLDGHDKLADRRTRGTAGLANMALRTYLTLRGRELREAKDTRSLLGGIDALVADRQTDATLVADEAINTAAHFALGGYLSTEFLIGTGITNLLRHREQWQALCDSGDDALLANAIDEMLRYDAPFQLADRWVEQDTELGGLTIPAGSLVAVAYGAANRDPAVFENPDRFDITRQAAARHFGFGHGPHRCIGEALARVVTGIALKTLVTEAPWVRLGQVGSWRTDPYFRSLTRVELLLQ
jgi:cytochrome P450